MICLNFLGNTSHFENDSASQEKNHAFAILYPGGGTSDTEFVAQLYFCRRARFYHTPDIPAGVARNAPDG